MQESQGETSQQFDPAEEDNAISVDTDLEEEEDLSDFEEWDRFDVTVDEFLNIRKSETYPLSCYKIMSRQDNNKNKEKCPLQSESKEICMSLSGLSKAEKADMQCKKNMHKREPVVRNFHIDEHAEILLSKLVNKKLLKRINGVIRVGREAAAYHADTYKSYRGCPIPAECVVKIFELNFTQCLERSKYILTDYRVSKFLVRPKTRKTFHLFAHKEKLNLIRVKEAGIPCPEVVQFHNNVVVMSFIGENYKPAPKLRHALLSEEECLIAYKQVIDGMRDMFRKARLIHTDLTEYNILWYNNTCYFIDLSQAVEPCHLASYYFLMEDCERISNFFSEKNTPDIFTPEQLFIYVTGYGFGDRMKLVAEVEAFNKKWHPRYIQNSHKEKKLLNSLHLL